MENKPEYYLEKYLDQLNKTNKLLCFVELVATPKRSDGTYDYCRETLEQKAKEILKNENNNSWEQI